ncbi:uncharacterized protein FIBRA_05020 [Fibroporia radiculosa]|uniref:Sacsin/Nov domain-containing protein n=1 Tax=Fibroporia radiculosa TaxID=599839 RepID=J4IAH2_9APHY|nr:uncharacterized protein FIBRA_05020 [Fibroporia radiculosa]CCM02906.1 predicted protein [Fibroporia radiculosa]
MPPKDMLWESGHDESVEVNQRALIDKVLARYSGEFTVFRELLQNSDDASAKSVEIHFETKDFLDKRGNNEEAYNAESSNEKKHELDQKAALVHQWTFRNDGMSFRDEDWNRLKKIAEGNPDEEKIGAFGVGFYSLFSVTEEPFVTSGGQWMGFYWKDKKDQLFARRGKLPSADTDVWTTFEMSLREPAPIPRAFDLTRFLASSLTFMTHLREVSVFLDDRRISRLNKNAGSPNSVGIPQGLKNLSLRGIMQVKDIQTTPLSIKTELIRWVYMSGSERKSTVVVSKPTPAVGSGSFFSSLFASLSGTSTPQRPVTPLQPVSANDADSTEIIESSVTLSVFTAEVMVKIDQKLRRELNRATKKNPPTSMRLELIYTGKDEYDASIEEDKKQPEMTGSVFQGLRADIEGVGAAKIFIGHATGQTTGIAGHIAARFIPTVERESIDLMDRTVAVWNEELLYVGGFLARAAYELEMANLRRLWNGAADSESLRVPSDTVQAWLRGRGLHLLKFFTFHHSTPSSLVSTKLEAAFFASAPNQPFPIISSTGIRNVVDVRIQDQVFSEFLKELPTLPEDVVNGAPKMISSLRSRGMIKEIEFMDVLHELRARPLSETEIVACFKWWLTMQSQSVPQNLVQIRSELLNAAVLILGDRDADDAKIVPMSAIQTLLNVRGMPGAIIPTDGPLPPHLLPVSISKQFDHSKLAAAFPWRELTLLDWLRYVTAPTVSALGVDYDFTSSPQWAERVLEVVSRAWQQLPRSTQQEVAALFQGKVCVPTSAGMRMPDESYFASAHIFRDLPMVLFPSGNQIKGPMEKVLVAIGVRQHVELQIVFNRMIKTGDWTIAELIKYLVAVQATLSSAEVDRLRMTAAFPKESNLDNNEKSARFKASELYEPIDTLRKLGLPIISWGDHPKWRSNSEEAKFLYSLGLRRYPPLPIILNLASNPDESVRSLALKYFLDNFATKYSDYDPTAFVDLSFVPAIKNGSSHMAKPSEVFSNGSWASLGFPVVDPSLQMDASSKLKIREHPPGAALVNLLKQSPPHAEADARTWFGILATRVSDFSKAQLEVLSRLPFVPVKTPGSDAAIRMLSPNQCYFSGDSNLQFHSRLFVFVDFGLQANQFLSACGTKHEPSVEEITKIMLENPRHFYDLAEGRDNYLIELRNIAVNFRLISPTTVARLKRSAILLGSRRVKKSSVAEKVRPSDRQDDLEEEDWDFEYDLVTPDRVVIADDSNLYQLFGSSIFTAPQEELIEGFYSQLGSKSLGTLVREEYSTGNEIKESRKAAEVRSLVLERLPLFLHEQPHTRRRITFDWLNDDRNFIVKMFGKLMVVKSLQFDGKPLRRTQESSAVAKRVGRGPIELWLAGRDQVDIVSTSMCRLLFESPKINDSLLFMTILSTDLRALKRRGYNVDRILRQQKAQREAQAEAAARSSALIPESRSQSPTLPGTLKAEEKHEISSAQTELAKLQLGTNDPLRNPPRASSTIRQSLDLWKRRFGAKPQPVKGSEDETNSLPAGKPGNVDNIPSPQIGIPPQITSELNMGPLEQTHQSKPQGDRNGSRSGVTPPSMIAHNVNLAINACKQEKSDRLQSRERMQMVEETLKEGYCDGSGESLDLVRVGDMGSVNFFVSKDISDAESLMAAKAESLARFIYVIQPLCEAYKLPMSSTHIYYDSVGHRIAFNRNASLFLNLRYFEAWHDESVQRGEMRDAQVSWSVVSVACRRVLTYVQL